MLRAKIAYAFSDLCEIEVPQDVIENEGRNQEERCAGDPAKHPPETSTVLVHVSDFSLPFARSLGEMRRHMPREGVFVNSHAGCKPSKRGDIAA